MIGTAIPIPVVETLVGATTGIFVNNVLNIVYDGFAHGKWGWNWENVMHF